MTKVKEIDIRIFDKELNDVKYFNNVRVVQSPDGKIHFKYEENGEVKYIPVKRAMQKTIFNIGGEPVYEKDVILYQGEPCMVYIDSKTHNAAFFYEKNKVFLRDVYKKCELIGHVYLNKIEHSDKIEQAIENFKNNIDKAYIKGKLIIYSEVNKNLDAGGLFLITEDGLQTKKRLKFNQKRSSYNELVMFAEGLQEIILKDSKVDVLLVKTTSEFLLNIFRNPGIIASWKRNGWKYKNGNPVQDIEVYESILMSLRNLTIKAEFISDKEREFMSNFLNSK